MAFVVLLIAYVALAVAYSLAHPLYESTDELRHVRYVRHLAVHRSLPVQRPGGPRAQSHHPPLYYALGAVVSGWVPVAQDVYYQPPENPFWAYRYWEVSADNKNQYIHGTDERFPFSGIALAVYLVRWMTILIGAGVVWLTYRIARETFPERPLLAVGGGALVAFNPQFLYLSGTVNNDVAAALCSAAVLLACIQVVKDGPHLRTDVTLGILLGLAMLTKFNLLALAAPIALGYLLAVYSPVHAHAIPRWRILLRSAFIVLGLAFLISGWWFWRNYVLYGDPTGISQVNELWAGRPASEGWWAIRQSWPQLWSSLWGRFGYGQIPLPKPIYQSLLVFCALGLAGYLIPWRRLAPAVKPLPPHTRASTLVMILLTTSVFVIMLTVLYYILIQPAGAMGRFLFPGLPAFAVLLIGGLDRYFPTRLSWAASTITATGMIALAVYALVGVLAPAFAPPRPLTASEVEAIPNATDEGAAPGITFGDVARLRGYRITPSAVEPGGTVTVTLYWEPLNRTDRNYAIFVHLLSEVGTMIAQRDTYPGLGRYPTTAWDPGVVFADTYRVHVPESAYTPDEGYVQVGMYLPGGPRLTTPDGQNAVRLETVTVQPNPGELPNPLDVNFGDKLALIGYELDQRVVQPGETIHLTCYWKALNPMEVNYKVFVHILGEQNQVWANTDSPLTDEATCTNRWEPGVIVKEVRELTLVETTPPDFYDIEIGLHASGQGRLKILAEDGRQLGNRTFLSKIRVVSE
jgi:4-amino-4-deoxy-L-arabinose transferase-like glycosyltransferase